MKTHKKLKPRDTREGNDQQKRLTGRFLLALHIPILRYHQFAFIYEGFPHSSDQGNISLRGRGVKIQ